MTKDEKLNKKIKQEAKSQSFELEKAGEKWSGFEMDAPQSAPLVDDATGKESIIRQFEFELSPEFHPTTEEILNAQKGKILSFCWKDGLEVTGEMKVVMSPKGNKFVIVVPCEVIKGHLLYDKPLKLQEVTNGS